MNNAFKHVVGFSGGVDSQTTLRVVRVKHGDENVIALNTNAGRNECSVTEHFIADYSKNVFPIIQVTALVKDMQNYGTRSGQARDRRQEFSDEDELTFETMSYIKGRFPSRKAQFCTEILKLRPIARWINDNLKWQGIPFARYVGLRCDESDARKKTPECRWEENFGCWVHFPIRCWSKMECFAYLKYYKEEVNPLYKMGFGRVGCAPCINSGKDDVWLWSARSPEMIDKIREWENKVWRTFFAPCVPGKEINWIDEVVEWAKTARGGKQPLLQFVEADAEAGTCSSQYGLCE